MKTWTIASIVLVCAANAAAQDATQTLLVGGRFDSNRPQIGGSGSVEWLRKTAAGGAHVGAGSASQGGAWWTFGRAGGFRRREGVVIAGAIEIGGGANGVSRFRYQRFDAIFTIPLRNPRLFLEAEGQLARIAADTGRLARVGIKSLITHSTTADFAYYIRSENGTASPAVSVRIDLYRNPISFLGGVVIARAPRTSTLLNQVTPPLTSPELFAGCAFGNTYRLQIAGSVSPSGGDANRISANLRIPLRAPALKKEP